jgi:hypothetical protein
VARRNRVVLEDLQGDVGVEVPLVAAVHRDGVGGAAEHRGVPACGAVDVADRQTAQDVGGTHDALLSWVDPLQWGRITAAEVIAPRTESVHAMNESGLGTPLGRILIAGRRA